MITDRTGLHEVLLPINHYYNKICGSLGLLKLKHKKFKIPRVLLACDGVYCPITLSY